MCQRVNVFYCSNSSNISPDALSYIRQEISEHSLPAPISRLLQIFTKSDLHFFNLGLGTFILHHE